jgi:hypothetical protein
VISWQAPNNAGSAINAYVINIQHATGGTWHTVSSCTGANPLVVTCTVPMADLTSATLGYAFGNVVYVRIAASNAYGPGSWSPISSSAGASVASVPTQMAIPTLDLAASTDAQVTLRWTALTGAAAGNSAVIAYSLLWDQGDSTRAGPDTPLMDSLATSYLVTGVSGGAPYRFTVSARNVYGPGASSPVLTVVPTDAPGKTGTPNVVLTDAT